MNLKHLLPIIVVIIATAFTGCQQQQPAFEDNFDQKNDRIWIGRDYWSIPMEDWRVQDGRVEFIGNVQNARVNVLTHSLKEENGRFSITVDAGLMDSQNSNENGSAGLTLGVKDDVDESIKSACYFGEGTRVGVTLGGDLFIGDKKQTLPENFDYSQVHFAINGTTLNGQTSLDVQVSDQQENTSTITDTIQGAMDGIVNLANNFHQGNGAPFWFDNLQLSGEKFEQNEDDGFGPILWAMHTLSGGTLKLSAQMPPLGEDDNDQVTLQLKKDNAWEDIATENINPKARNAIFTIDSWQSGREIPYQLVYQNQGNEYTYEGVIAKEPDDGQLSVGGLTCQHGSGYPYGPVVDNLEEKDPDLLYFSGDQLYESNGGYPIKRKPESQAILSYLGKFYMFGWAFGDVMRNKPTIITPDDHDVFQGNIWGEGGEDLPEEIWEEEGFPHGGYLQQPGMVNVVHKTQCGQLPEPYDPEPLPSGISVWYTDVTYGNVSFAVTSDRMFKSGPAQTREKEEGRLDHIEEGDPDMDVPNNQGLSFLGDRQVEFLHDWIRDWQGADMKVLLSQTVFANVATHHGQRENHLIGDMDSGGWPKSPRDSVIKLMRKAYTFHINGDQHVPFLVQYGLDECRDAGWSFCTPAIATGYARWFLPDSLGIPVNNRPEHGHPNTGCYEDAFGNKNYVYAVGNPLGDFADPNRYRQAQNKSSGYAIIDFNTDERTIAMNAYRFLDGYEGYNGPSQYPGWPHTIDQWDNDGREPLGYLPEVQVNKSNQVVRVYRESDDCLVNIRRMKGDTYRPAVYRNETYRVVVGEGDNKEEFEGVTMSQQDSDRAIEINL